MNNKSNSKIKKNNKERSKKNKTKKIGGAGASTPSDRHIGKTDLWQGTQIYYTNEYNFVIDLLKKNKIDLTLKHKPKEITIEKIKEKIKENSSPNPFHKFWDHRLILMIQNTNTNKIELQKFYDDLIETLKTVKHRIYIFLPFYCGYNINHPTNTHSINKKKLVNLSNPNLYFFDIDKIYSLRERRPGALVFGREDSYYNQKCENLSKIGEYILVDLFKKIKEDDVENIKTKPIHYDYITRIDMPLQNHLGTQYQMSIYNQQKNSQSNLKRLRLIMYGVDKRQEWHFIQQSHLRKLERNGTLDENVLILGDSWSAGYYIDPLDPYNIQRNSNYLAKYVSTYSNKNIYYPDMGAFSYTSKDLLDFLNKCCKATSDSGNHGILKQYLKNDVGIVVLFIGINDGYDFLGRENNKRLIKDLLKKFNNKIKILVVEYPKNLFELSNYLSRQFSSQFSNQYSSISSSSMVVPMVNSASVSGYHKYGKEIADGIKSLEKESTKELTLQLTHLQPSDLSIKDKSHLSTDSEILSMYRIVGGKNNKKQKYVKYKTKEVLGKNRQIFRKKDSKSKKEYIIYKKEYILLKNYIKLKKSARK
tara:strand:+ start:3322 stop:5091 length:1770 start_codon:yes stop_codon:yes gene_type:complete